MQNSDQDGGVQPESQHGPARSPRWTTRRAGRIAVRGGVAAALTVDAAVHALLASNYQLAAPGGIGAGTLFRGEALLAALAALYVLIRGTRPAFAAAFGIAVTAFAAVILSRYLNLPPLGPIPAMYEPVWSFPKALSATAEALGAALAATGLTAPTHHPSHTPLRGR